jgi:hypothetical protein
MFHVKKAEPLHFRLLLFVVIADIIESLSLHTRCAVIFAGLTRHPQRCRFRGDSRQQTCTVETSGDTSLMLTPYLGIRQRYWIRQTCQHTYISIH